MGAERSDGNRLIDAREAAGLTEQGLAEAIGVRKNTILAAQRRRPPAGTAAKIADALGTTVDELWGTDPDAAPARRARIAHGFSQRGLAERTGLSLGVIQRADRGEFVRRANATRLADALELEPEILMAPSTQPEGAAA